MQAINHEVQNVISKYNAFKHKYLSRTFINWWWCLGSIDLNKLMIAFIDSLLVSSHNDLFWSLSTLLESSIPPCEKIAVDSYTTTHPQLDLLLGLMSLLSTSIHKKHVRKKSSDLLETIDLEPTKSKELIHNSLLFKLVTLASHSCRQLHTDLTSETKGNICALVVALDTEIYGFCNKTLFYACDKRHDGCLTPLLNYILRFRHLEIVVYGQSLLELMCEMNVQSLFYLCCKSDDYSRIFCRDERVSIFTRKIMQGFLFICRKVQVCMSKCRWLGSSQLSLHSRDDVQSYEAMRYY